MTDLMFEKCPESLRRKLEASPDSSYDLILRVSEVGDEQQKQIEEAGFNVRRRTSLIPTFSVTGSGESLQELLSCSWLIAVEQDQPVRVSVN